MGNGGNVLNFVCFVRQLMGALRRPFDLAALMSRTLERVLSYSMNSGCLVRVVRVVVVVAEFSDSERLFFRKTGRFCVSVVCFLFVSVCA